MSDEQKAILEFETTWWKYAGAKEAGMRERFGLTPTIYYARLNHTLDLPAAMEYDAMTVKRLQRLREARKANRSEHVG